jgi:hypothetical protein
VATYYVDLASKNRPFYNNIRKDVISEGGPLRSLGCLGIGSLAENPPSNFPVYHVKFPVEVVYQVLEPSVTESSLAETANKIAKVSLFCCYDRFEFNKFLYLLFLL